MRPFGYQPDYRALSLALVVGLSVLWPLPHEGLTAFQWYGMLMAIEATVVAFALLVVAPAAYYVAAIHTALFFLHLIQYFSDPYGDGLSMYSVLVPTLEGCSLAYICFTSKPFLRGYHGSVAG
jgi:hypothetical protein